MAANVGTPRFYIDSGDYWKSLGTTVNKLHTLNPSQESTDFYMNSAATDKFYSSSIPYPTACNGINFYAVLGHNIANYPDATQYFSMKQQVDNSWQEDILIDGTTHSMELNTGSGATPQSNGFSIGVISQADGYVSGNPYIATGIRKTANQGGLHINNENRAKINSFVFGKTYDMPHSPDLSLKLSYEMDGVKNIQTKGGATLSNASYTKPADWGSGGAWQLGNSSTSANYDFSKNYRSGRRVWDLSFSYLSDSDIMPSMGVTNNLHSMGQYTSDNLIDDFGYTTDDVSTSAVSTDGAFRENVLISNDFFSQVWNKTMGGHLPFIFQPNGNLHLADQFAIARFDQSSLQYDQVAHNTYNVKLKIRESW